MDLCIVVSPCIKNLTIFVEDHVVDESCLSHPDGQGEQRFAFNLIHVFDGSGIT
jgi:hypothetical protein